jgi:hypothetical protein
VWEDHVPARNTEIQSMGIDLVSISVEYKGGIEYERTEVFDAGIAWHAHFRLRDRRR